MFLGFVRLLFTLSAGASVVLSEAQYSGILGQLLPPPTERAESLALQQLQPKTDSELLRILQSLDGKTFLQKLDAASHAFLGRPYGFGGPLGEGPGASIDRDPLYRVDRFDCTTYIETVLALAYTRDVSNPREALTDFRRRLESIRYAHGKIDFLERNHLTELDWTPHLERMGYLKEATSPFETHRIAHAVIDKAAWFEHLKELQGVSLLADRPRIPPQSVSIPYLPKNRILQSAKSLPQAAVLNIVRPDWKEIVPRAGTPLLISHQVLLLKRQGLFVVRHASSQRSARQVIEQPLHRFVTETLRLPSIGGIQVLELLPPASKY